MTVKELIGKVMVALDEVTSYNLMADIGDYEYKIYEAIDSTQTELATTVSPIVKTTKITAENGVMVLPSDLFELITIMDEDYREVDFDYIKPDVLKIKPGEYNVSYNKYPEVIRRLGETDTSVDEMELEVSKEACEAMVYGVCAALCINDEPDLYNSYMARYTGYMTNIMNRKEQTPKAKVKGGVKI